MAKRVLTDLNITDCMDAAGYGIGYWAWKATLDEDAKTYTVWPHEDPFDDENNGKPYVATYKQLSDAYYKLIAIDQEFVNREIHNYFLDSYRDRDADGIEGGHIDATAAAVWVQVALFGEVIFG